MLELCHTREAPAGEDTAFEPLSGSAEDKQRVAHRFRKIIYRHFRENERVLPWRETDDPYAILVSEIMLQQTQVERVSRAYGEFLAAFPDFRALAEAPLREVLRRWQGLGYNRRAVALQRCSRRVVEEFGGNLPCEPGVLRTFPGIGRATAGAISAFAFGKPTAFVETNIRRVFIHFFFRGEERIPDSAILPLVEATLDRSDPRGWYYALMDYGVMLKRRHPNPHRRSAHYARQGPFEGSNRQLRGRLVRLLTQRPTLALAEIAGLVGEDRERVERNLTRLGKEGFLAESDGRFSIR